MLADAFVRSGKVRDLHRLADGRLLLVASDRISAFDVILPSLVPDKGRVLTGLSRFWFAETASLVPNHLLDTDAAGLEVPEAGPEASLRGRIMVCRPASVIPIEAVVRGYLAGSGWKEYRASGTVCGIPLPAGLREGDRLPEPIFTPATKADLGAHDENITFDGMVDHIAAWLPGPSDRAGPLAEAVRDRALRLYGYGAAVAARRGILVADTKFEFGIAGAPMPPSDPGPPEEWLDRSDHRETEASFDGTLADHVILIDEALTPDSSRFWDAATYEPGGPQASFDKQYVRDWLDGQGWDRTAPGPALPDDVVAGTRARYVEAYERVTGASFERYLREDVIAP